MSRIAVFDHQFVAACLASVLVVVSARARAAVGDPGTRPVRIEYDAPATCPDQRAFEAQLRARSARIVIAPDAKTAVRVRIGSRGPRFAGEVALTDAAANETRHVDGVCTDVVAALSLIAAVALDPMASTASDPLAPPVPSASPAPASALPPTPLPTKAEEKKPAPPVEIARVDPSSRADEVPGASTHHEWRWSIGAGVGVTGGVAPDVAVSIPVFVDVARWSPAVLAPAFRLRFERATIGGVAGGADFTWTTGSLDLCPVAWSASSFRVWPCARVEAGALEGAGDATRSRTTTRPWVSAGALARARVVIVGGLFVELEAGGYVPFVRDRFFLEPDQTVHRAPFVSAAGAASLGASFW